MYKKLYFYLSVFICAGFNIVLKQLTINKSNYFCIDTSSAYRALYQQRRSQELKLHELLQEKYNGLVRLLKPGCRTIVLLCDVQSRKTLLPAFHKAVWPYRRFAIYLIIYNI